MTLPLHVACSRVPAGWTCEVTVEPELLARLRPGADEPTDLVRDSFAFLLAREPRESILRDFALPVIGRYFPEWEREIAR